MAYTGIDKKLQFGKETTYGTKPASNTMNLNYLNESIEHTVEKTTEESLLASKMVNGFDIVGRTVSGDMSLIMKPEQAGTLFAWALGKEAANPVVKGGTTGVYEHTLTGIASNGTLPSATITIDRGANVAAFTGCKVDKFSLSTKAKEVVNATVSIKGHSKETGTITGAVANPSLSSFRFIDGVVKFDTVSYGKITDITFNYENGLEDSYFTLDSGLYSNEHTHTMRTATMDFTAEYDATTASLESSKYEEGNYVAIEWTMVSPATIETDEPYAITISIPAAQITTAKANVAGKDRIMISLSAQATENGGVEPITVKTYDIKSTKYF